LGIKFDSSGFQQKLGENERERKREIASSTSKQEKSSSKSFSMQTTHLFNVETCQQEAFTSTEIKI